MGLWWGYGVMGLWGYGVYGVIGLWGLLGVMGLLADPPGHVVTLQLMLRLNPTYQILG